MTVFSFLVSTSIGITTGFLYGLFFIISRRRVFSLNAKHKRLFIVLSIFARILLLCLLWFYLLHSTTIALILVLLSFIGTFWIVLITQKAI